MYESPIVLNYAEPIIERIKTETEEYVFRGIIQCGFEIDKEELVKALKYDRGQYDKGYGEGWREGRRKYENELNTEEYKNSILVHEIESIMRHLLIVSDGPGKVKPVKNTSKDECYKALYKIQELLDTRSFKTMCKDAGFTYFSEEEFNKMWEEETNFELEEQK